MNAEHGNAEYTIRVSSANKNVDHKVKVTSWVNSGGRRRELGLAPPPYTLYLNKFYTIFRSVAPLYLTFSLSVCLSVR